MLEYDDDDGDGYDDFKHVILSRSTAWPFLTLHLPSDSAHCTMPEIKSSGQ
jgi:hypothetical protein